MSSAAIFIRSLTTNLQITTSDQTTSVTPPVDQIAADTLGAKRLQPYVYVSVSLVIAILLGIQVCRSLQRRRLRQRLQRSNDATKPAMNFKDARPEIFTVHVEKEAYQALRAPGGWMTVLPLSSNIAVRIDEPETAPRAVGEDPSPRRPNIALENSRLVLDTVKDVVMVILDVLTISDRWNSRRNAGTSTTQPSTPVSPGNIDPTRPRDLVASFVIAMPSALRAPHNGVQEFVDEDLPEIMLGVIEQEWDDGGEPSAIQ